MYIFKYHLGRVDQNDLTLEVKLKTKLQDQLPILYTYLPIYLRTYLA